jgi:hypothetical protein
MVSERRTAYCFPIREGTGRPRSAWLLASPVIRIARSCGHELRKGPGWDRVTALFASAPRLSPCQGVCCCHCGDGDGDGLPRAQSLALHKGGGAAFSVASELARDCTRRLKRGRAALSHYARSPASDAIIRRDLTIAEAGKRVSNARAQSQRHYNTFAMFTLICCFYTLLPLSTR